MTRPYRPSNGSEGEGFQSSFCDICERDRAFRDSGYDDAALGCKILANALAFDIKSPEFPKEWVEDDDGGNSRCTAFTTDPAQPMRCSETKDLFGYGVNPPLTMHDCRSMVIPLKTICGSLVTQDRSQP